jgi:cytoskeletal protein CcmA (bactofilin family)
MAMIFRRKKPNEGEAPESPRDEPAPLLDAGVPAVKPFQRPSISEPAVKPVALASKIPSAPPARGDAARRIVEVPAGPRRADRAPSAPSEGKKLLVGRDICLNGHISACERLMVEGNVEAELTDCRTIEIADSGSFKGTAEVDGAEVSGRFEGSITVHERLLIRSTGRVSGTIRYGRIEIEQGGEINGDVKSLSSTTAGAAHPESQAGAEMVISSAVAVNAGEG